MSKTPASGDRIDGAEPTSKKGERSDAAAGPKSGSESLAALKDPEVVARAAAGDHEAYRVLVERYQDRAYRLAFRVMREEEQAKDVVQDAFIKAYRSLDRFEGRSSFYTWLYRIVMNLCIDAKRRRPAGRQVEWDEGHAHQVPVGTGLDAVDATRQEATGPAGELERAELRAAVGRAIEQLPEDARRTLLLREVEGLSYLEIAEATGAPKGTVMSRLHHARRRVRALLVEQGLVDSAEEKP